MLLQIVDESLKVEVVLLAAKLDLILICIFTSQRLDDMGYGDDCYKLTMLNMNKTEELITVLDPLPGHRTKLQDLFRKIQSVSIKNTAKII